MSIVEQEELDLLSAYRLIDEHPSKDKVLTAFMSGIMSYERAAKALGVLPGELFEYTKAALTSYEDRDLLHATSSDLIAVLRSSTVQIRRHAKDWMALPAHASNLKNVVSISRELRALIKDIVELEKTIKESDRIELQNAEMYLSSMSNFLTTGLCAECQLKAIDFLQEKHARQDVDVDYEVVEQEFDPNG